MAVFSGKSADLLDALAYELHALEYLRRSLYGQSETSNELVTIALGDLAPNGNPKAHLTLNFNENICASAVQEALSQLRPLAFSAAFKMQDMIVEWILRANGCTDWRFQAKLRSYDRLSTSRALAEPKFFQQQPSVGQAFWETYRHFEPYRGTVTHAGGVVVGADGTLQITKQNLRTLNLSNLEQAAYIQALCIVSRTLIDETPSNQFLKALVENSLARLSAYHGISNLRSREYRLSELKILVPTSKLASERPLAVNIDWKLMRSFMRDRFHVGSADVHIFFPATVEIRREKVLSRWSLPLDVVPDREMTLYEGDSRFDPYLVHYTEN